MVEWSLLTARDQEVRSSNLGEGKIIYYLFSVFFSACLRLSFEEVSRKDKKNDEKNSIYRKKRTEMPRNRFDEKKSFLLDNSID